MFPVRVKRLFLIALGILAANFSWAQNRPPYYPGGTRLTVASEICFGPFRSEDFNTCVNYLINGDFNLASDVEFEVLKNFVIMANTVFDPEIGFFRVASNIDRTLELFSRVEGASFSRDLLNNCAVRYINIGGVAWGRNDGEYLGCVQRYIVQSR